MDNQAAQQKLTEFCGLVKLMRQAQRTYFRSKGNLAECKGLESQVDKRIEEIEGRTAPRLFE